MTGVKNFTATGVNDAPILTAGSVNNLTVLEDSGFTSLGLGTLAYGPGGGADEAAQTLTYQVTIIPSPVFGDIYLADGLTKVTTTTYTLAQIQGMQFKPADDANGGPSFFSYRVIDDGGGTDTLNQSIQLNVTPVNDEESLDTNTALTLHEGAWGTITATELATSDADHTPAQLVYTVDSAPTNGTLYLNWVALAATDTFTQADIDAGLITYRHDSGETTSDSFDFTVDDSTGTSTSNTFNFIVNAVNDAPVNMFTGQPQTVASSSIDGATDVHAADLNGDGDIDLVSSSYGDDRIVWYENDGTGGLTAITVATGVSGAREVFVADVDNDGHMDILSAAYEQQSIIWYENDGAGPGGTPTFTAHTIALGEGQASTVFAIDLDNDGDTDVLAGYQDTDEVVWYENDGLTFTRNVIAINANAVKSVVAGDLDGDGDIDVASVSYIDDKVAWYENDGMVDPAFTQHVVTSTILGPISMEIADVDGDGNDDLVVAAYFDGKIAWYRNDGSPVVPTFTENIVSTSATGARDVAVADLDGDGDADIISAAFSENEFAWYESDGGVSPAFVERVISVSEGGPRSVAVADMDGDSDLDVVGASYTDDEVGFFENTDGSMGIQVTAEDTPLTFNAANSNLVWISDSDASALEMKVRLEITNGTISLNGTTGLFVDVGVGTNDSIVEFRGSVTDINAAIDGMTFTPTSDFNGVASIRILTDDQGNSGNGGALTDDDTINITVTPVNDSPTVAVNSGVTVLEGSTGTVITAAMLNEGDVDDTGVGLVYMITNVTDNGTMYLSGFGALGLNDTFTQADIDAGVVTYDHDGSETSTDAFSFSLADGGEDGATPATGTFNFVIDPLNDAPVVTAPGSALSATEQIATIVHGTGFSVTDADETGAGARAVISVGEGTITIAEGDSGVTIDAGNGSGSVTILGSIAQINNLLTGGGTGTISYLNSSDTPSASTTITVLVNDAGNTGADPGLTADATSEEGSNSQTINITAVNDEQVLSTNTGTTVLEGSAGNVITTAMLETTDVDNTAGQLVYTVTSIPTNGVLRLGGGNLSISSTFTQADIDGGLITYLHNGTETIADSFSFTVDDGVGSTSGGTFNITVTPVNDNSATAVSDNDATADVVLENASVGTTIGVTGFADDADIGDSISYSLDDNDGGRFKIDAITGIVTVDGVIDREADGATRSITVRATSTDSSSTTRMFVIGITDVDEFDVIAPVDSDGGTNEVDENVIAGTTVGLTASAFDGDATNNTITYSLTSNPDGLFQIDSSTGVVTTGAAIDRETHGATHAITVQAQSSDGSLQTQSFNITINDLDEFDVIVPVDSNGATDEVDENAANGTTVGVTASASDADATNNTITYSLDDNAGGRFAIDGSTGVVTVADGTLLDREAAASHNITVRASSSDGSSNTQVMTINLNDVDEFNVGSIADGNGASDTVAENAIIGTAVGVTALATDADATNNAITYTLDDNAGGRFAIDGSTGVITVNAALDYETNTSHNVIVRATSSDGSASTQSFTINVTDVSESGATPIADNDAGGRLSRRKRRDWHNGWRDSVLG